MVLPKGSLMGNVLEDDDDQRDYKRHQQQRPRYEEPIASRIRRDIIFISELEDAAAVRDQCAGFGRDIANNFEDDQVRGPLLDTLVDMLIEQPLKIPFLAAVALYANDLNAESGREFITRASKKMAKALELGDWRDFKLLLRFHACLQGVLEGSGVFQILNQLFDWVIDLQSASAEDVRPPLLLFENTILIISLGSRPRTSQIHPSDHPIRRRCSARCEEHPWRHLGQDRDCCERGAEPSARHACRTVSI
jgi:hypothetical protein